MKPGDLVRFKEGTPIFKREGETFALITDALTLELDGPKIIYLFLLMPTGEVKVRRSENVEVVIEAG